jgi:Ca2+-transporting ATPase
MSPLQKELTSLSKKISLNVLIVGVFLFVVALLIDLSVYDSFLFALGICMSLVPQGMPAQISVALSLASARLAKKQVVVKKLSSVETL